MTKYVDKKIGNQIIEIHFENKSFKMYKIRNNVYILSRSTLKF